MGTRCFLCNMTLVSIHLPPLRMYKLPTICGPSALDFVRRIGIVLSQSALPWKMARRFCHLQSVTIDVSCDIVLSKDELEGKTMQLRYNISRRGKMHASCGNILYRIIGGRHEGSSRTIASNSL